MVLTLTRVGIADPGTIETAMMEALFASEIPVCELVRLSPHDLAALASTTLCKHGLRECVGRMAQACGCEQPYAAASRVRACRSIVRINLTQSSTGLRRARLILVRAKLTRAWMTLVRMSRRLLAAIPSMIHALPVA